MKARRTAERCFAVARSTTHEGERIAAIARGMAVIERYGLDPDDFDIPGRERGGRAAGDRDRALFQRALDRYWSAAEAARERENRFHHLCAEARARDRRHAAGLPATARQAADELGRRGVHVYPDGEDGWVVFDPEPRVIGDAELLALVDGVLSAERREIHTAGARVSAERVVLARMDATRGPDGRTFAAILAAERAGAGDAPAPAHPISDAIAPVRAIVSAARPVGALRSGQSTTIDPGA